MRQEFGLVIFDCDGVLVDSERIDARVSAAGLTRLGWALTEEDILNEFVGRSDDFVHAAIVDRLGARVADDWLIEFRLLYREAFVAQLKPVAGIVDALDAIAVPICVASNGTHEKIAYSLGLVGLADRFAGRIFSAGDVGRPKPAPDLFLHAAAAVGVKPGACAVVEDSAPGVEAARAAGMRAFAYAAGVTPRHRLEGPETVVFTDMRTLPQLLFPPGEQSPFLV